jgi:putative transposase
MCLRFVFLLITRVAAWLRLARREDAWKTAEILILRHQLSVLQRRPTRRPKLSWADQALLAALLGLIPKARRQGCVYRFKTCRTLSNLRIHEISYAAR